MSLELIVAGRVEPQRWRNGGGFTRELFAWPAGEHWACRISLAEVSQDGAFSPFPGVTRWFAVIEGAGVVLDLPAGRAVLDRSSPPLCFDGALAPHCSLQGGATSDLNLMLRKSAASGAMFRVEPGEEWLHAAPWRAVFTTAPALLQIDDTDALTLPAGSLALSRHAARQRWRLVNLADSGTACWLAVSPKETA